MSAGCVSSIPLASVAPGTRLAAAVLGADGQMLMAAGSVLTEAALEKLAARGIVAVPVESPRSDAELAAARDALRQRLAALFRKCDLEQGGAARMLFDAVLERRLEDLR